MGEFNKNDPIVGDWVAPSPSPRTFFATILDDEIGLKESTELPTEKKSRAFLTGTNKPLKNDDMKDAEMTAVVGITDLSAFSQWNVGASGGLLERIAARAGFNAPRLVINSIKTELPGNSAAHQPYLTIPPGLSPTSLLESPVFLSNASVQPSRTTGKFQFASNSNKVISMMTNEAPNRKVEDNPTSSFAFNPVVESGPPSFPAFASTVTQVLSWPSFPRNIEVSNQLENSTIPPTMEPAKGPKQNRDKTHVQAEFPDSSSGMDMENENVSSEPMLYDSVGGDGGEYSPRDDQRQTEVDQTGYSDSNVVVAPAEDGYSWRKYGQKQVKGSEYPRSYYKCTHQTCPVKKKVERSHEGHVTEIIYKGVHNHPKPPPNRRLALASLNGEGHPHRDDQVGPDAEFDPAWTAMKRTPGVSDWRHENLVVESSFGSEYCDASSSMKANNGIQFEAGDALDGSSTFSNDEDEHRTHASASLGYNGKDVESELKRRKIEPYSTEMSGAARSIKEPRVVVQTTSEVDILDDGYRWRKYGQKVVKGNPNPRSYYKCTSAGCIVRKHVERASHDLKSVITTYEGRHNHDIPTARNNSHANSTIVTNALPFQTTGVSNNAHWSEASLIHNSMPRFDRPPSHASFGLPIRDQLQPSRGFAFGVNRSDLENLAMARFSQNHNKLAGLPIPSYIRQQHPHNSMGSVLRKEEPKVELMSETNLNVTNGSSFYHQIMSRLPLGPQM